MDETRLVLIRMPAHIMLWREGEFLFSRVWLSLEAGPPGPTPQAFIRKLRLSLKVRQELEPEGFTPSAVLDVLPWQHILVLTRTDAPRRWLTRRSV